MDLEIQQMGSQIPTGVLSVTDLGVPASVVTHLPSHSACLVAPPLLRLPVADATRELYRASGLTFKRLMNKNCHH